MWNIYTCGELQVYNKIFALKLAFIMKRIYRINNKGLYEDLKQKAKSRRPKIITTVSGASKINKSLNELFIDPISTQISINSEESIIRAISPEEKVLNLLTDEAPKAILNIPRPISVSANTSRSLSP